MRAAKRARVCAGAVLRALADFLRGAMGIGVREPGPDPHDGGLLPGGGATTRKSAASAGYLGGLGPGAGPTRCC